jgi:hypothetical protein
MKQSYFQRAKHWIEVAEDVDIEILESTLTRFSLQYQKLLSNPIQDELDLKDLSETIEYLNNELILLAGVEALPIPSISSIDANPVCTSSDTGYNYDPSPLLKVSESEAIVLSKEERQLALLKIKSMSCITPASTLSQFKRNI